MNLIVGVDGDEAIAQDAEKVGADLIVLTLQRQGFQHRSLLGTTEERVIRSTRLAVSRGVVTEVEVIREENAWTGIWHAAGRLGVDAFCLATHGRSGLARVVLGSQAQEVMQRARQPVILVPPEREG